MECPRCGTQNDDTRQFCFTCGNPLASNMLDPIDFGKTQATPVVVTPIEPMTKEEELKNTSVIPVVSETIEAAPPVVEEQAEPIEDDEETKKINAIREELAYTSEMEKVKVNIQQLESVKKPKRKKPVGLIIVIIMLFLICASGVSYYLIKKDKISFLKKTTTTTSTTTTTEFKVALDEELKAKSDEIILNANSHKLKYSYEITKFGTAYRPVLKVYLDDTLVVENVTQENDYKLKEAYDAIMSNEIYTIEEQVVKGNDKDYYYININVNNQFYVFILNETSCIYKNITTLFEAKDTTSIYNNKSSLLKDGKYYYLKQLDEENSIEQVSIIENDVVTFVDGETIPGLLK